MARKSKYRKVTKRSNKKPVASWHSLPNELRDMIFRKMDFQTRLKSRLCFRNFDKFINMYKQKYPVEICIKYVDEDQNMEVKIELKDARTGCLIMRWVLSNKKGASCKIERKQSDDSVLSTKVVDLPSPPIGTTEPRLIEDHYRQKTHREASQIVENLFRSPMLSVKLFDIDFDNMPYFHCFHLYNWPLDVLVLRNYTYEDISTTIQPCFFNYRVIKNVSGDVMQDTRELLIRSNAEKLATEKIEEIERYKEVLSDLRKTSSIEAAKCIFQWYIDENQKKKFSSIMNKILEDLMCLRAAFYDSPEPCLDLIEEKYAKKIAKLREGIDNPKMPVGVLAMISRIYMLQKSTTNRGIFYNMFQSVLEDSFEVKQPNIYNILLKKIEWLQFGDVKPTDVTLRTLFSTASDQ